MHRLLRALASGAAAFGLALSLCSVMTPTALGVETQSWNCRKVVAVDIRYFAYSTTTITTYPGKLGNGARFRTYGVVDGRYRAEWHGWWGYTTGDSSYVVRVADSECNW
jgi:hypothetical protein